MSDDNKFTTTRSGHMTNSSSLKRRLLKNPNSITQESLPVSSTLAPSTRLNNGSLYSTTTNSPRRRTVSPSGAAFDNYYELNTLSRDRLRRLLSQYLQADSVSNFPTRVRQESDEHPMANEQRRVDSRLADWSYIQANPRSIHASITQMRTSNLPERKSHTAFGDNGAANNSIRGCLSASSITRSDVSGGTPSARRLVVCCNGYTPDSETSDDAECGHGERRWNFRQRKTGDLHYPDTVASGRATDVQRDVRASRNDISRRTKPGDIALWSRDDATSVGIGSTCWRIGSADINGWTTTTLPHRASSDNRHRLTSSISWEDDSNVAKRTPIYGSLDRHHSMNSYCLHDVRLPTEQHTIFNDAWSIATPTSTLKVRSSRSETEKVCITADTDRNFTSDSKWKMLQLSPGAISADPSSQNGFQTWPRRLRNERNFDDEVIWLVPIGPGIQVLEPESIIRKLQSSKVSPVTVQPTHVPRRRRLLGTADSVTSHKKHTCNDGQRVKLTHR